MIAALLLAACSSPVDTGGVDSGETGVVDSGETGESGETDTGDSGDTQECTDTGGFGGILTPEDGAAIALGEVVALSPWWTGSGLRSVSWSVDGVVVGTTLDATWTADPLGQHEITLVLDAECYGGTASITVDVVEPSGDSHTTWDAAAGVPTAVWYGLSVAPDGVVWGATSAGVVRLDPTTAEVRTFKAADGLLTDYPRSVLAASDGTIWVGHVGDTKQQGEQVAYNADGTLTVLQPLAIGSSEVSSVYRLREEPYGTGAGDVWMGTNEGMCLFDVDLGVYVSHAHPTHPHDPTYGLAFTTEGDAWNGDGYQLSRWRYDDDGEIYADLLEYWVPWPVPVKEPVSITDADVDSGAGGDVLWIASSTYGVARVDVSDTTGMSTTECLGDPFPPTASAIRADGDGHVWIGSTDGLRVWDEATATMALHSTDWLPYPSVQQLAVDTTTSPRTVWAATAYGLVQIVGLPE